MKKRKGYELGLFFGFLFGIFVVFFLGLGVISASMEVIGRLLIPIFFPFRYFISELGAWSFVLNGVLFSLVGIMIQYFLRKRKKNEKIVLYIFLGIVALLIFLFIVDILLGRVGA